MKTTDESFRLYVLESLEDIPEVRSRRMFGGHGIYAGEKFFGILSEGTLYFKTNEASKKKYQEQGMDAFEPNPRQRLKNYYEVPAETLDDRSILLDWAREAIAL